MFVFVLKLAAEHQLLAGKTVAVDSTMLEADAAMKSIVRRATGEDWKTYLRGLAAEAGLENPTDEELRRFDKTRRDKKVSNDDWMSPNDAESRIARMKDGTTHPAYKAEHVVDLETDLVLSATIYPADRADTETLAESVVQAQLNVIEAESPANIKEAVADKGYHAAETLAVVNETLGVRTYIPEPKRKRLGSGASDPRRSVGDHRQSSSCPRSAEQEIAAVAERIRRTDLCSCLRDRRSETLLVTRVVASLETLSAPGRGADLGLIFAQAVRNRHAEGVAERRGSCRAAYLLMSITWCIVSAYRRELTSMCASAVRHGLRWPALAPLLKVAQVQQPVSAGGVFADGFLDDCFKFGRDLAIQLAQRRRVVEGDLLKQLLPVGAVEDRLQGEQFVERDAERIDVGPMIDHDALGQRLLGAHVAERADEVAGHGQAGVGLELGEAEVGDPQVAASRPAAGWRA